MDRISGQELKNLKHTIVWTFVALAAVAYLTGCGGSGGGGGGGNRGSIPPAGNPVCKANVPKAFAQVGTVGGGAKGVVIPPTSVPRPGRAHTNHLVLARAAGTRGGGPQGLSPAQVIKAYSVPANSGSGAIAVVDAFNYSAALPDFNTFSQQFGLPQETSSNPTASTNTVFQVVYAAGAKPTDDAGWAQESAVDTQWAHAMAPRAKIYLVESASDNLSDLMTAVNLAKTLPGVRQVSISFGSSEDACSLVNYDSYLLQSGVEFFASSGDTSGERDFPAESMNVVAVGGTTLNVASDGTWLSETVWNSTGGGASSFEPRPVFQDAVETITGAYRADADIAAVGDPQTGVSVYDSVSYNGGVGWQVFGGTSAATPIIAGIANASGTLRASSQALNTALYASLKTANFHDIVSGASGTEAAAVGYDFPTGVGSPNGVGGF